MIGASTRQAIRGPVQRWDCRQQAHPRPGPAEAGPQRTPKCFSALRRRPLHDRNVGQVPKAIGQNILAGTSQVIDVFFNEMPLGRDQRGAVAVGDVVGGVSGQHERFFDNVHLPVPGNADHPVPVLETRQGFVESPHTLPAGAARQDRRRPDKVAVQQFAMNVATRGRGGVDRLGFDASIGVNSPVRAVDHSGGLFGPRQLIDLSFEFVREPLVVAVLKSDQLTSRGGETGIACSAAAAVVLMPEVAYSRVFEATNEPRGVVGGRIVDDKQFQRRVALAQNALDRLADRPFAVVGR